MFENVQVWSGLGYRALDGCLDYGKRAVIERASMERNGQRPDIDDQIVFKSFKSKESLDDWVVQEIKRNLSKDELRAQDIMVAVPEALPFFASTSGIRDKLRKEEIKFHLVGKDTPQDAFWDGDSVAICNLYHARANEAPMVYVIDANTSWHSKYDTARIRNRLYSAMTRSKAWVRVVGIGKDMELLAEEYERIKSNGFRFDFAYPTRQEQSELRIYFGKPEKPHSSQILSIFKEWWQTRWI
jgi:superfamily I DNA and RNA helicase